MFVILVALVVAVQPTPRCVWHNGVQLTGPLDEHTATKLGVNYASIHFFRTTATHFLSYVRRRTEYRTVHSATLRSVQLNPNPKKCVVLPEKCIFIVGRLVLVCYNLASVGNARKTEGTDQCAHYSRTWRPFKSLKHTAHIRAVCVLVLFPFHFLICFFFPHRPLFRSKNECNCNALRSCNWLGGCRWHPQQQLYTCQSIQMETAIVPGVPSV